jgi:Ca2+-binding RTX toxin-like protein
VTIISYNSSLSTVSYGNIATLTVTAPQIVTANATTFALTTTLSGALNGPLDIVYGGNFTVLAGVPIGGTFTSLHVDFNHDTLIDIRDFSLPYGAGAPDFSNLQVFLGGADVINGGALADVINGFTGADSANGAAGLDIMNGNQGDDSLNGGDGDDIVRGGQGNDVVMGGTGNDFISGDRGSDTLTGGTGADLFHTFVGAGLDRVTDFNRAEGDHVLVLGHTYAVSQVGADTVIDLGSGDQMILVGVQQTSLTGDWIVGI